MKHPHQFNLIALLSFLVFFHLLKEITSLAADLSGKIRKKEGKEELILKIMQFCKMSYELESGMIYVEGGRELCTAVYFIAALGY